MGQQKGGSERKHQTEGEQRKSRGDWTNPDTSNGLALLIPRVEPPRSGYTADSERAPPAVEEEMKVPILPYRHTQTGSMAVNPLTRPYLTVGVGSRTKHKCFWI